MTESFDRALRAANAYVDPDTARAQLPPVCEYLERYSRGAPLFPRQKTIMKILFLEEENFTDYDRMVIDEWMDSTRNEGDVRIPLDLYDRMRSLKERGCKHFRQFVYCGGRRGGKGFIGSKIAEFLVAQMIALGNPQRYYGIDESKDMYIDVLATTYSQAQGMLYNDIKDAVLMDDYIAPYLYSTSDIRQRVQTPADKERESSARRNKSSKMTSSIASIIIEPHASNSASIRGRASFMQCFDELAHGLDGGKSTSVFEAATPSLEQFGEDGFVYVPSSPWSEVGKFYDLYQQAFAMDGGKALDPATFALKIPSWEVYAQPYSSLVLTPSGYVRMGDIEVGDLVIGGDGKPVEVVAVHERGEREVNLVSCSGGGAAMCTDEHLWSVGRRSGGEIAYETMSCRDVRDEIGRGRHLYLPRQPIVEFGVRENPPASPYALGRYLGGGRSGSCGDAARERFVPDAFKHASPEDRWSLVRGLMDAGGHVGEDGRDAYLDTASGRLRDDFAFVLRSMGCRVSVAAADRGGYRISFVPPRGLGAPFGAGRKADRWNERHGRPFPPPVCRIESVERAGAEECRCITVANDDGLYITDDFIVTHNCDWQYDPRKKRAIVPFPSKSAGLRAREQRNPEAFDVEFRANFAKTENAYLNQKVVDKMFDPYPDPESDRNLFRETGEIGCQYFIHADAGRSQDLFAMALGHREVGDDGFYHVFIDHYRVWQPSDFPLDEDGVRRVDYLVPMEYMRRIMARFYVRSFTMDQWNSAMFIDTFRRDASQGKFLNSMMSCGVYKKSGAGDNFKRWEKFKTAAYQGWVHIPRTETEITGLGSVCLPQEELKLLRVRNGKVDHQEGSKWDHNDQSECISVVVHDLLSDQLDALELGNLTQVVGAARGGYNQAEAGAMNSRMSAEARGLEFMRQMGYI